MQPFSANELARMQIAQESAMQDTCIVYTYSAGSADSLGHVTPSWEATAAQPCGYKPSSAREVNEGGQVVLVDVILRLPLGAVITSSSRVKITHRFGVALAVQPLYHVVGEPARGPSGLVVNLQRVNE